MPFRRPKIGRGISKARQYWRELRLCARLGADPSSRARLGLATLNFHLRNGLHLPPRAQDRTSQSYRIRWGGRDIPIALRTAGGDLFVFHEVFLSRCYDVPEPLRKDVRTVVDLGAHIGLTTLYLSAQLPHARFVCVEPDRANAVLLRENVAPLGRRARFFEGAIGRRSGMAGFAASGHSWGGRLGSSEGAAVRCYSMKEMMSIPGFRDIDLLKVDIEGGEEALFHGSPAWLRRVRMMVIEIHEPYSLRRLQEDLGPRGFRVLAPDAGEGRTMVMARRGL